jgi:Iap family predicted aminopeptidase
LLFDQWAISRSKKLKGLSINYNYLNLPSSVSSSSQGKTITYTYDATGKKLKKSFPGQADHYYMDGVEYDGSTLLFAMTEEGRVRPKTDGTYLRLLSERSSGQCPGSVNYRQQPECRYLSGSHDGDRYSSNRNHLL